MERRRLEVISILTIIAVVVCGIASTYFLVTNSPTTEVIVNNGVTTVYKTHTEGFYTTFRVFNKYKFLNFQEDKEPYPFEVKITFYKLVDSSLRIIYIDDTKGGIIFSMIPFFKGEKYFALLESKNNRMFVAFIASPEVDFTFFDMSPPKIFLTDWNGNTYQNGSTIFITPNSDSVLTSTVIQTWDNKGYIGSYDFLNNQAWKVLIVLKVYNTTDSNFSVMGMDKVVFRGSYGYFISEIPDFEVSKMKDYNNQYYVLIGQYSHSFTIDVGKNFTGQGQIRIYLYADADRFLSVGSFGSNSEIISTINFNIEAR